MCFWTPEVIRDPALEPNLIEIPDDALRLREHSVYFLNFFRINRADVVGDVVQVSEDSFCRLVEG